MLVAISEFTDYLPCGRVSPHGAVVRKASVHNSERSVRHHRAIRLRIVAVVALVASASSVAVVAFASTSAAGLPAYTNDYASWPKINRKPVTRCGPPCAHAGVKNVYASKKKVGAKYPNGTVIVKTVAQPGDRALLPNQVAVMRKLNGSWRYVEYALSGSRYTVLAQGQLCQSCHVRARANDYVFTKR
jgi:Cytochrome P460